MPKVYAPAVAKDGEKDKNLTHYLGFVGNGVFDRDHLVSRSSVTDGTSNTLMIAEAVTGVPWTKPEDLEFTGSSLLPKLGGQSRRGSSASPPTAPAPVQEIPRPGLAGGDNHPWRRRSHEPIRLR